MLNPQVKGGVQDFEFREGWGFGHLGFKDWGWGVEASGIRVGGFGGLGAGGFEFTGISCWWFLLPGDCCVSEDVCVKVISWVWDLRGFPIRYSRYHIGLNPKP